MRILLVIDETNFYQPGFVADLIKMTKHKIVGCALVTKVLPKSNITRYLLKHFYFLTFSEIFKLAWKKGMLVFKDVFKISQKGTIFYSVKSALQFYKIDYIKVEYNINQPDYINWMRKKKPDVIISSNSLIFGKDVLNIPKYCINRHSSLLPQYGGLWPIIHAVSNGEQKTGVSVHIMTPKIDDGIVIAQQKIHIEKDDTIDTLYQKSFAVSASVVIEALKKIENGVMGTVGGDKLKITYYSFPDKSTWRRLRKRKVSFI